MDFVVTSANLRMLFGVLSDCPDKIGLPIREIPPCVEDAGAQNKEACGRCWEEALLQGGMIKELGEKIPTAKSA